MIHGLWILAQSISQMVSSLEEMVTFFDLGASAPISGPTVIEGDSSTKKVVMKNVKCVILQIDNYFSWEVQFCTIFRGLRLAKNLDNFCTKIE